MRSTPAAFAWEFARRLRWGLIALGAYLLVLAIVQFAVLGPRPPINPARSMVFAFTVNVPLTAGFLFLIAVFSHGLSGDLAARQSMYPARMFTLPVSTAALAGYPMLYGTLAMAALAVVATLVAFWPSGVNLPLVWPALFAAAMLAWTQVFTWMPYGLPGLRPVIAVLWLTTIDAGVLLAVEFKVPEPVMVAFLAPQFPLAYLAARAAVARARRGDVPDWRGLFARLDRLGRALPRARGPFPSPARAQAWFEWREHGRSLPGWVALLLPFELGFLYIVRDEPRALTSLTLAGILLTPPFLAAFVAMTVGRSSPEGPASYGLTAFTATRPLSTAALVRAKLRMAGASTLAAWLLVAVAIPLGLTLAGQWPALADHVRHLAVFVGPARTAALLLLAIALLLAATWKQLVQGLAIGLTGREGLIKSSVLLRLCLLILVGLIAHALRTRGGLGWLFSSLPWIVGALACVKMGLVAWIAARLVHVGLLRDRALVAVAASWLAAVLALYVVLAWLFAAPQFPHYFLVLLSVLVVPVVRPSLVPLALAWNRHRGAAGRTAGGGSRRAIAAVLALFLLPLTVALGEAVAFYTRNANNGSIVSSGLEREYLLHVPQTYDPARPTPLVISMHGAGLWPVAHMQMSRWTEVADEHGFIVVYPSGLVGSGPRVWRLGRHPGPTANDRDVRFIADLIDTLKASYNIDPARIYADGLSNGGGMAFALSCTLSDRIAAVGLVASAQLIPWHWCTDPAVVPMIAFHGTADRFAPYHGGTSPVTPNPLPDIPTWAANWARRNRCAPEGVGFVVADDVTRHVYTRCANDADVVLYTIHGGGHTWPGGGPMPEWFVGRTSRGVDASRESWAFFRAHPLRRHWPAPAVLLIRVTPRPCFRRRGSRRRRGRISRPRLSARGREA